jgi:two-component system LytT family response regulator
MSKEKILDDNGTKLRVLVADDELLCRERLRRFIRAEPNIEVVAECASGTEVVKAIREKKPDLAFLDIRMPELDGFGVLEALKWTRSPAIIFVTAYDQFALRAFEFHAVDYLLKPFDRSRFRTALERALERLQLQLAGSSRSLLSRLASLGAGSKTLERLVVKSRGRITILKTAEVDWISAADNYTELHVANRTYLLRMTITALANRLPQQRFTRISRSLVVNVDRLKEICPKSHGDFLVYLHDGKALTGSRNFRNGLAEILDASQADWTI